MRKNNKFLTDSFIAQAIPYYDSLPPNIRLKTTSKNSLKRTESIFLEKIFERPKSNCYER